MDKEEGVTWKSLMGWSLVAPLLGLLPLLLLDLCLMALLLWLPWLQSSVTSLANNLTDKSQDT